MRLALALAAALIAWPAAPANTAPAASRYLTAPSQPGVTRLTPRAYAYVPQKLAVSAPIIVLLHGAGGNARAFLDQFKGEADKLGIVLVSLQSAGQTWGRRAPKESEPDVENFSDVLMAMGSGRPVIDANRVTIMGFSDGASYGLSLGLAYPQVFRRIVAFSPGYAFASNTIDPEQRIFIAHGRRDRVLPPANVRDMVKGLRSAGYAPELHWFNGGHEIDPKLKQAAFDFALRP